MQIAKDWNFSLNNLKNFFREKNKKTEPEIYEFMRLAIFTNGDGNPIPVYSIQDDFPEICEGFINSLNALERDYNRQIEYLTANKEPQKEKHNFSKISGFILEYPKFEEHFESLKENGYLEETGDGFLNWKKKKSTLARYIDYISETDTTNWKIAEMIFQLKRNTLSANFRKETNEKEFKELQKLILSEKVLSK